MRFRTGIKLALVLSLIGLAAATPSRARAEVKAFRLLPPTATVDGRSRAQLLVTGYTAKVLSKVAIETSNCADRPQFGETAGAKTIAGRVFTLPAQLGRTLTCTMSATSILMIDHIGVICNDGKNREASVECIEKRFEPVKEFRVTFDGIDLGAARFRIITEKFVVDLPNDSPFGLHRGKWRLRAGGWPILLSEVTPGRHVVETSYKLGKNRQTAIVNLTVVR